MRMKLSKKKMKAAMSLAFGLWAAVAVAQDDGVRIGEAYRYFVGPYEVKMRDRISAAVKCERNFTSVAIEVLGCAGVNVTPVVVPENTAAKLVGTASVKTDAQMKALVYRSGHETEEGVATCTSGEKRYVWDASLWPDGEVNEARKWIVVPVSCTGSWGGLPSFSVRLKGFDIASDSYYIQTAEDAMPSINAKSIFGLVCKQLGGSSVSGFQFKVNGYAYSMTDEGCKGIAPWWMFDWNEWETESVSMTVEVPEAGLLAIRGYWPNGFGAMHDWSVWQISGDGVSEELPRPNCYEDGALLKINCSRATTVTLRNDADDKFTMADLAFSPASSKSVHIVGDFVVSRRVENASGEVFYPLYVNGYVTGGGTYKAGEKVTMVAHAAPGMKCDHWEITDQYGWYEASTISFPDGTDTSKETLSFVVPESFCGEMSDMKVIHIRPIFVEDPSADSDGGDSSVPGVDASYGPFVPGEKVELELPSLVGYAAKGLPSGLKFNAKTGAVTGAVKKPTGEEGAKVTFSKKGAEPATTRFIVGPVPTVSVTLAGGTNKCSVAGADKAYLAGKKVTLTAKAPKGTAFLEWTTADGVPWPDAESAKKAKLTFTMPAEDLALVATFKEEEVSLACPTLEGGSFTVGVSGDAAEGMPIEVVADSDVKSVKASKLPSGMKLVKDKATGDWSIVGTPTKAGTYEVVLTVTTAAGSTRPFQFAVTVDPLPAWAVGTFTGVGHWDGEFSEGDTCDPYYNLYGTVSVGANGRLSGSLRLDTDDGRSLTAKISASALTGYDIDAECYYFDTAIVFRSGRTVFDGGTHRLYVGRGETTDGEAPFIGRIVIEDDNVWLDLVQNVWKRKDYAGKPVFAEKKITLTSDSREVFGDDEEGTSTLTLVLNANGKVNATLFVEGSEDGRPSQSKSTATSDLLITFVDDDRYSASIPLPFKEGILNIQVEMSVDADGKIRADGCKITGWTGA